MKSALVWKSVMKRQNLYKVEYTGNSHISDGEIYTEIYFKVYGHSKYPKAYPESDLKIAREWTMDYWKGEYMIGDLKEIVVDNKGTVKVIEKMVT